MTLCCFSRCLVHCRYCGQGLHNVINVEIFPSCLDLQLLVQPVEFRRIGNCLFLQHPEAKRVRLMIDSPEQLFCPPRKHVCLVEYVLDMVD